MTIRRVLWGLAGLAALAGPVPAQAVTFRYAFQGDIKSLDPYTLKETFAIAAQGNAYEGLTTRDKDLKIVPALAERWENPEPTRWRFYLRHGVKFHDGSDFTADDVVFSATRVRATGSDFASNLPKDAEVVKVDDYTVDFKLTTPNPILHYQFDNWYMMSKKWAEAHDAVNPTPASATTPSYAALHENGTGPFVIESHQPGVKTVFKRAPSYWGGKIESNLDEAVFTTIGNDATRVAALLSGEVDWVDPVPLQDQARVAATPNAVMMTGPELRTIFLGMDQTRDELLESNVKGKNPFKDERVRQAFMLAIDENVIKTRVMRNQATASALMIAPQMFELASEFKRPPADPEKAKKLLAEAGYPSGFEVGMDCPNDRYVNDGDICQAVVSMLSRVGVKVNLNAQPKAKYFAKVLKAGGYGTSFYLLGWTPSTNDSHNVLYEIMGCRNDPKSSRGGMNLGGYCDPKLDALTDKALVETDVAKRNQFLKDAFQVGIDDAGYIPLHQQALAWGVSKKVTLTQRPDNQLKLIWVSKQP